MSTTDMHSKIDAMEFNDQWLGTSAKQQDRNRRHVDIQ